MGNLYNPYQMYQPTQLNAYPTQMNVGPMQSNAQPIVGNNTTTQVQNGGFISVPSEDIVKTYPVAPGNCVTFKIEGQPVVMEKSMGFSQFESPKIERYRLVKEDIPANSQDASESISTPEIDNSTIDDIKDEIKALWRELDILKVKENKPVQNRKKENGGSRYDKER